MATTRRIGTETSKTRALLLATTERILLEEGYAAVSSRRVAAAADVKPALIHYYFPTMDDLFLAVFRRGADRNMERLRAVAEANRPLRALWDATKEQRGSLLLMEFAALARHRPAVRSELAAYGEQFRALQLEVLGAVLTAHDIDPSTVTAGALGVLMTGLSIELALERELGMRTGHADALALVDALIEQYEPASPA